MEIADPMPSITACATLNVREKGVVLGCGHRTCEVCACASPRAVPCVPRACHAAHSCVRLKDVVVSAHT